MSRQVQTNAGGGRVLSFDVEEGRVVHLDHTAQLATGGLAWVQLGLAARGIRGGWAETSGLGRLSAWSFEPPSSR